MPAFTLVEVLITIVIVGVVAVLTLPNLISKISKIEVEVALKKNYASIQQAVRLNNADEIFFTSIPTKDSDTENWVKYYISPKMRISKLCVQDAGCWHNAGIVKTLKHVSYKYDNVSGPGWGTVGTILSNGAFLSFDVYSRSDDVANFFGVSTPPLFALLIDVNGFKKPNVIGKDIYFLYFKDTVGFVPACSQKSKSYVDNECLTESGYCCLQKVVNDNFKIDDSVWKR